MKTSYTVAVSMFVGAAIGAAAIQGVNAQAKKVYLISESEVINSSLLSAWETDVEKMTRAQGGNLMFGGRIIATIGDPPKRVGITEFASVEKAQAWFNSPERKAMGPQRDKVIKIVRQYIVEGK